MGCERNSDATVTAKALTGPRAAAGRAGAGARFACLMGATRGNGRALTAAQLRDERELDRLRADIELTESEFAKADAEWRAHWCSGCDAKPDDTQPAGWTGGARARRCPDCAAQSAAAKPKGPTAGNEADSPGDMEAMRRARARYELVASALYEQRPELRGWHAMLRRGTRPDVRRDVGLLGRYFELGKPSPRAVVCAGGDLPAVTLGRMQAALRDRLPGWVGSLEAGPASGYVVPMQMTGLADPRDKLEYRFRSVLPFARLDLLPAAPLLPPRDLLEPGDLTELTAQLNGGLGALAGTVEALHAFQDVCAAAAEWAEDDRDEDVTPASDRAGRRAAVAAAQHADTLRRSTPTVEHGDGHVTATWTTGTGPQDRVALRVISTSGGGYHTTLYHPAVDVAADAETLDTAAALTGTPVQAFCDRLSPPDSRAALERMLSAALERLQRPQPEPAWARAFLPAAHRDALRADRHRPFVFNGVHDDIGQVEPYYADYLAVRAELDARGAFPSNAAFEGRVPGLAGGEDEDTAIYLLQHLHDSDRLRARLQAMLADGYQLIRRGEGRRKFRKVVLYRRGQLPARPPREYEDARVVFEDGQPFGILPKGARKKGALVDGALVFAR